jgi:hypothetical protein
MAGSTARVIKKAPRTCTAGIADQVSGIAKSISASRRNRRDIVFKGDIAAYGDSLPAIAPNLRGDAFGLIKENVVHCHPIAVAGQPHRDGAADARTRSGDDRRFHPIAS